MQNTANITPREMTELPSYPRCPTLLSLHARKLWQVKFGLAGMLAGLPGTHVPGMATRMLPQESCHAVAVL